MSIPRFRHAGAGVLKPMARFPYGIVSIQQQKKNTLFSLPAVLKYKNYNPVAHHRIFQQ